MLSNGTPIETVADIREVERLELAATAKPILKWAGGKRQLEDTIIGTIDRMHPNLIEDYREPFVGGGAIFFALQRRGRIRRATLSDTNAELIWMYRCIRDDVEGVIQELQKLCRRKYSAETYYKIREACPSKASSAGAARMIYLNKTCFNGLYRVNKSGLFNTPFGKRANPTILDRDGLRAASAALRDVALSIDSFETSFMLARPNTFTYYDPPYVPVSKSSDFSAYQAEGFTLRQQRRLAECMNTIAMHPNEFGQALLSNSHCPATLKLYQGLVRKRVAARRSINADASKRGYISELLVESRFRVKRK